MAEHLPGGSIQLSVVSTTVSETFYYCRHPRLCPDVNTHLGLQEVHSSSGFRMPQATTARASFSRALGHAMDASLTQTILQQTAVGNSVPEMQRFNKLWFLAPAGLPWHRGFCFPYTQSSSGLRQGPSGKSDTGSSTDTHAPLPVSQNAPLDERHPT